MVFFMASWVITVVGWAIHVFVDGVPSKRSKHRVLELLLLWLLVVTGVFGLIGGLAHISGISGQLAEQIGYAPSMFQWEVGWGYRPIRNPDWLRISKIAWHLDDGRRRRPCYPIRRRRNRAHHGIRC